MHLAGRPAGVVREVAGLTIIPARASFRHARALAGEAAAAWGEPDLVEASLQHLDDPHWDALLALRDGVAVARVGVLAVGEIGRVEHVFVSAPFRRQGIGRTMVGRALEICARSLFKHVMLSVRPDNGGAIALYEQLGFRKIGRMTAYRQNEAGGLQSPGLVSTA
jgi:ribosomal protein S18 acetylase RimI-like enzyme